MHCPSVITTNFTILYGRQYDKAAYIIHQSLATTLFLVWELSTDVWIAMDLDILPCLRIEKDFRCNGDLYSV